MPKKIYINMVGLTIEIDMIDSIVEATNLALNVRKPDKAIVIWTPEIYDGTKFRYVTKTGDLNQPGIYIIQPSFTLSGWSGPGDPVELRIYDSFE
jgi:hypothetical protein